MPNFLKTHRYIDEILRYFAAAAYRQIFQMAATTILDILNRKILLAAGSRVLTCITVPNFIIIGQSIADIMQLFDFPRWRAEERFDHGMAATAILNLNLQNFNGRRSVEGPQASLCQMLSKLAFLL